jgi:hypothetical protein
MGLSGLYVYSLLKQLLLLVLSNERVKLCPLALVELSYHRNIYLYLSKISHYSPLMQVNGDLFVWGMLVLSNTDLNINRSLITIPQAPMIVISVIRSRCQNSEGQSLSEKCDIWFDKESSILDKPSAPFLYISNVKSIYTVGLRTKNVLIVLKLNLSS